MNRTILLILAIAQLPIYFSCTNRAQKKQKCEYALLDSVVVADVETWPVSANVEDDSADDPAIWRNPSNVNKSVIIGTNKKGGLAVYALDGRELFYYPHGRMNNVDVRYNFPLSEGKTADIAVATNRSTNTLAVYSINKKTGALTEISQQPIVSLVDEVYGFSLYKSPKTKKYYAFVNSKTGQVEQWELAPAPNAKIKGNLVRQFNVGGQTEGMVADDELANLFIGQENCCIWKYGAEPTQGEKRVKIEQSDSTNQRIKYDIEGLTIYYATHQKGYLIASIQGNNTYAVFERAGTNNYIFSFSIQEGSFIDGAEETDGIDVLNLPLGHEFPNGLLVVQDGFNYKKTEKESQNFKLIDWAKIAGLTSPDLLVDTLYKVMQ